MDFLHIKEFSSNMETAINLAHMQQGITELIYKQGQLTIIGVTAGTPISIYNTSGRLVGSAKASVGTTDICTTLRDKDIAIVKIGSKSVKVVMK